MTLGLPNADGKYRETMWTFSLDKSCCPSVPAAAQSTTIATAVPRYKTVKNTVEYHFRIGGQKSKGARTTYRMSGMASCWTKY